MADFLTVDYNQPSSSPWQLGQGFPQLPSQFNQFKPPAGAPGTGGQPPAPPGYQLPGKAFVDAAKRMLSGGPLVAPEAKPVDCPGFMVPVLKTQFCWSDILAYGVGGLLVIFGLLMVTGGTIFGVVLRRRG